MKYNILTPLSQNKYVSALFCFSRISSYVNEWEES